MDPRKIARLQTLVTEKKDELRQEETKLRNNMESWVRLTDMRERLMQEFADIKQPIDISSPKAKGQLDGGKLIIRHDIYAVQVQANMKKNYKNICRILEETQTVVEQLKEVHTDYEKLGIVTDILNGLDKPKTDWETLIKKLAAIIKQLG
ncbi:unnamed protein product [Aureobasidium uvarum]|uniref:Uncharacterized protein n=1 Tax=Aureobasidium uvarum TaxID=2773716 RepID=A0A9N8KID4_9PEZI|nr:unnamed protein product [Aureobasidium uvarum]